MKSMSEFDKLAQILEGFNTELMWRAYAQNYNVLEFSKDGSVVKLLDQKDPEFSKCPGVYRLICGGITVYVGLTILGTMSKRVYSHSRSFKKEDCKSEVSGRKIREHMQEYNLDKMMMEVQMIDMSNYTNMIGAFEQKSIRHFKPMFNTHFNTK